MVDFNNETTVTRSQKEIVTFQILEARYNVLESLELYYKQENQNTVPVSKPALQARIKNLFFNIYSSLLKDYAKKDEKTLFAELEKKINSKNLKDNIDGFKLIDVFLYDSGVTKYYTKRNYNSYNTWEEDEAKGI